jgi:hypothetical protein
MSYGNRGNEFRASRARRFAAPLNRGLHRKISFPRRADHELRRPVAISHSADIGLVGDCRGPLLRKRAWRFQPLRQRRTGNPVSGRRPGSKHGTRMLSQIPALRVEISGRGARSTCPPVQAVAAPRFPFRWERRDHFPGLGPALPGRLTNKRSALIKRQALAKRFPISKDELTKLAQEAAASVKPTICPPGEASTTVGKKLAGKAQEDSPKPPR